MSSLRMDLPEVFSGEDGADFHQWIRRFELASEFIPGASEKTHILLPARLSGPAFIVWEGLSDSDKKDFSKIKAKLSQVFGRDQYLQTFRSCITARKRLASEPLEVYASAIITMVEEAFPKYDGEAKDGESFRRFTAGLDSNLQKKILEMGGTTMTDALNIAVRVERANQQAPSATISATESSDTVYLQLLKRMDVLEKKLSELSVKQEQDRSFRPRPSRSPSPVYSRHHSKTQFNRSPSPRSTYTSDYGHRHSQTDYSGRHRQGQRPRSPSPHTRRYTPDYQDRGSRTSRDEYRSHYRQGQRSPSPRAEYERRPPSPHRDRYRQQSPSSQPTYHHRQQQPDEHFHGRTTSYSNNNRSYSDSSRDVHPRDDDRRVHFADHDSGNFY